MSNGKGLQMLSFESPIVEIDKQIDSMEEKNDSSKFTEELESIRQTRERPV